MITLKEYPEEIIPENEYIFKWTVEADFFDNVDDLTILNSDNNNCSVISKAYTNRHILGLSFSHVNYDVDCILKPNITSELKDDVYISITHTTMLLLLPVGIKRKVLKYKFKSGKLILESITDKTPCLKDTYIPVIPPVVT